ncbi:carbohydrate kinase family protein [Candidatus Cetobacterium colombiensis]|uniref:PfkB family carbohydrate kinase n=1 Tax=Candidatus Cetobacterium colombiensis TaxID=3073100 RepID=A0ABU4WCB1_9FUSO|nr:PfkB family carbohydrate kinase [Candidatus Cetobacterium colombiensis]MDX8337172.1 PfkB family carbohydrate kinase [Candidatus Cetobacterium colombiensis]
MNKILCVGHSACDITYVLQDYPMENRKYKAEATKIMGGGPTGNAAYLLGKFGEFPSYITTLGKDFYGDLIIRELNSVNVDLKNSLINEEYTTPCSMIITNVSNGSRTILNHRNKNYIPDNYKMKYLKEPEIILFDGHEIELARVTLEKFPNALTVLDAGSYKEETVELGQKVDYLICSEDFARDYAKVQELTKENYDLVFSKLEELNGKNIVITLGEKGCIYKRNGELYNFPAFKTKAIDTTGAGDIFHGAFVYSLGKGYDFIKAIKFSSACASLSVEKIGGRESIPELKDVYERMEKWQSIDFKI